MEFTGKIVNAGKIEKITYQSQKGETKILSKIKILVSDTFDEVCFEALGPVADKLEAINENNNSLIGKRVRVQATCNGKVITSKQTGENSLINEIRINNITLNYENKH